MIKIQKVMKNYDLVLELKVAFSIKDSVYFNVKKHINKILAGQYQQ